MFYEFMALEPQAFGLPQSRVASNGSNRINTSSMIASTNIFRNRSNGNNNGLNSLFGVNEARAIGLGKGLYLQNNPDLVYLSYYPYSYVLLYTLRGLLFCTAIYFERITLLHCNYFRRLPWFSFLLYSTVSRMHPLWPVLICIYSGEAEYLFRK